MSLKLTFVIVSMTTDPELDRCKYSALRLGIRHPKIVQETRSSLIVQNAADNGRNNTVRDLRLHSLSLELY